MKIITSIIFIIFLLTTSLSALATEVDTDTNQTDLNITGGHCTPQPQCGDPNISTSTLEQWIDQLEIQHLMELLKIQQEQPTEASETHNE
jgi:hypothetical protein